MGDLLVRGGDEILGAQTALGHEPGEGLFAEVACAFLHAGESGAEWPSLILTRGSA